MAQTLSDRIAQISANTDEMNKSLVDFVAKQTEKVNATNDEYEAVKKETIDIVNQIEAWQAQYKDVWATEKLTQAEREEAKAKYDKLVKDFNKVKVRREQLVAMRKSI